MTLRHDRERAHSMATHVTSAAIAIVGVTLAVFAFFLVFRGGLGFVFLALLLLALGGFLAAIGFFFQLVPFRLAELARLKRDHDERVRPKP